MEFSQEQRRQLQNLSQYYETWKDVSQALARLPGGMYWRVIHSKEYLYKFVTTAGIKQSTSVGPKNAETEARIEEFQAAKKDLQERLGAIEATIGSLAPVMRALNLPAVDQMAGKILRAFDQVEYLGKKVLVVGTYAISAYEVVAQNRFAAGLDATEDLDFTIVVDPANCVDPDLPRLLLLALKHVDRSFMVSPRSPMTVVNRSGYRVDLLMPNDAAAAMQNARPWKPEALDGQEWLLLGTPVHRVVLDLGGWPVFITAPDPRYFALHKLWLSKLKKRIELGKSVTDRKQGIALLNATRSFMPHYPLDKAFAASLPVPLRSELQAG